ncbi:MAG TPA: ABC transporter transmembrane domain-containing protein, partial [Tepidisphaeraceae bacterium]|nr:ABC transporter transmembrane domain-containing protein [Tepidisphaeraceae bacterium]
MISILCAFVVGATFTSGLGTVLPIMQVLINKDTVADWVNRKVVESRLDVRLGEENTKVRVSRIDPKGVLATSTLQAGQILSLADSPIPGPGAASHVLNVLADPQRTSVRLLVDGANPMDLPLRPLPFYLGTAHDLASKLPTHPVKAIAIVLTFLIAMALFGNIVRFFQEYLSEKAAVLTVRDIRMHMYDHSLRLNLDFYGRNGTSDITSRLTQDAQGLQDGLKSIVGGSVQESIKASMALGLALFTSWQLTLFIIGFGPLMFVLIKKFGKKIRRAARAALQNSSTMLGQIEGSLMGIRVVKSANAERFERRRFRGIMGQLVSQQLHISRLAAINTPVLELLTLVVVCGIVLGASYLVLVTETLKAGEFFLVMAALMGIGESLRKVSKGNTIFQKSNAAAGRIFEMIDLPG